MNAPKVMDTNKFRSDLNLLRALSVFLVIMYHLEVPYFVHGYLGVDIFFVLSGYFISNQIHKAIERNQFKYSEFYIRRLKRLAPPLYFMLIVLTVYSLLMQPPFAARDYFQSLFATVLSAQNYWLIYEQSDYFALDTANKILLHTWSLSVEEQFYLIFPFFCALLFKKRSFYLFFLFCLFLLSFLSFMQDGSQFYSLHVRIWEFVIGVFGTFRGPKIYQKLITLLVPFAFILLLFLIFYPSDVNFVHILVIVICVGIICAGAPSEMKAAPKFFVNMGLMSYSLYLWHQPVISIIKSEFINLNQYVVISLSLAVTYLMAWISYAFIEKKYRYTVDSKKVFKRYFLLTIIFLIIGGLGHISKGYSFIKEALIDTSNPIYTDHFLNIDSPTPPFFQNSIGSIILVGDSMARDLQKSLGMIGESTEYKNADSFCFTPSSPCWLPDLLNLRNKTVVLASDFVGENKIDGSNLQKLLELSNTLKDQGNRVYILNVLRFKVNMSDLSFIMLRNKTSNFDKAVFGAVDPSVWKVNHFISENFPSQYIIDKFGCFCDENTRSCRLSESKMNFYDKMHLTELGFLTFAQCLKDSNLETN